MLPPETTGLATFDFTPTPDDLDQDGENPRMG
jgi:hypothetical protein